MDFGVRHVADARLQDDAEKRLAAAIPRGGMQRMEEVGMVMKKTKKATKSGSTARAGKKVDLTKPVKVAASAKARTKGGLFQTIAEHVGIARRDVAGVFHVMGSMIKSDLSKAGSGVFTVPGLMRITVKRKPATKARPGINPFTKEPITIKAKPARNVVRVRPLRALKGMV
jgi:nucleoid DNA-binding protein